MGLIEEKWQRLLACFPDRETMTPKQIQDVERLYWAGASCFFQILVDQKPENPAAATALVEQLHAEVIAYITQMREKDTAEIVAAAAG